ncbi:MAG: gamma-glutamylcyclotransferase [Dongiaceae bacterium]
MSAPAAPDRSARMDLTEDLVARVERLEPDPGPMPGVVQFADADYAQTIADLMAQYRPERLHVFAYGSLLWKPEFEIESQTRAVAHGWHRAFCLRLTRWRGTREQPGLMMALDRGGCCNGVLYRLPAGDIEAQIDRLLRREMSSKPPANMPRWLDVEIDGGSQRALAFTANPKGNNYCGKLTHEDVARILARAAGHWGSGASYLYRTVAHLDALGIRDRNLWRLQQMVAAEIRALGEKQGSEDGVVPPVANQPPGR